MRSNLDHPRRALAELRSTLLQPSPGQLEAHIPALESAVQDLESLCSDAGFTQRRELEAFSVDLLGVARLIEHGMMFQQGWARVLSAAASNYQPNGKPMPLEPAKSLMLKG